MRRDCFTAFLPSRTFCLLAVLLVTALGCFRRVTHHELACTWHLLGEGVKSSGIRPYQCTSPLRLTMRVGLAHMPKISGSAASAPRSHRRACQPGRPSVLSLRGSCFFMRLACRYIRCESMTGVLGTGGRVVEGKKEAQRERRYIYPRHALASLLVSLSFLSRDSVGCGFFASSFHCLFRIQLPSLITVFYIRLSK